MLPGTFCFLYHHRSVPQSLSVAHAEDITRCFFLLVPLQQCTRYVVAVVVVIVVSGVYMQEEVSSWCCGCVRWFDDIYSGDDIIVHNTIQKCVHKHKKIPFKKCFPLFNNCILKQEVCADILRMQIRIVSKRLNNLNFIAETKIANSKLKFLSLII